MAVLRGKHGTINGANTVRYWMVMSEADDQAYHASNVNGGTGRIDGNTDWQGIYRAYGHTPAVWPGDAFSFAGAMNSLGTVGASGTAIVQRIRIVCPIEEGGKIWHEVLFGGNGALTLGTVSVTPDTSVPNPPAAQGCKVAIGNPTPADVTDVRGWELVIEDPTVRYANSGTSGGYRRESDNLDAQVQYDVHAANFNVLPTLNANHIVRLYVTASIYWELKWAKVLKLPKNEVPIEDRQLVSGTVMLGMNGHVSGTTGWIKNPAGTTKWP